MKVSLDGLIENAGSCLKCSRDSYGPMYAYVLEELRDHIKGVVRGEITLQEFAEHYCITNASATAYSPQGVNTNEPTEASTDGTSNIETGNEKRIDP